jgi:hypothetical protein
MLFLYLKFMLKLLLKIVIIKYYCIFVPAINQNKKSKIMTRLETLQNRLENVKSVRDIYFTSEKINGKIYVNPKSGKYGRILSKISKEIRLIENN